MWAGEEVQQVGSQTLMSPEEGGAKREKEKVNANTKYHDENEDDEDGTLEGEDSEGADSGRLRGGTGGGTGASSEPRLKLTIEETEEDPETSRNTEPLSEPPLLTKTVSDLAQGWYYNQLRTDSLQNQLRSGLVFTTEPRQNVSSMFGPPMCSEDNEDGLSPQIRVKLKSERHQFVYSRWFLYCSEQRWNQLVMLKLVKKCPNTQKNVTELIPEPERTTLSTN